METVYRIYFDIKPLTIIFQISLNSVLSCYTTCTDSLLFSGFMTLALESNNILRVSSWILVLPAGKWIFRPSSFPSILSQFIGRGDMVESAIRSNRSNSSPRAFAIYCYAVVMQFNRGAIPLRFLALKQPIACLHLFPKKKKKDKTESLESHAMLSPGRDEFALLFYSLPLVSWDQ